MYIDTLEWRRSDEWSYILSLKQRGWEGLVHKRRDLNDGLHLNTRNKMQIPRIYTACDNYRDGQVKDSSKEYSSMLSDTSDPKLSIGMR